MTGTTATTAHATPLAEAPVQWLECPKCAEPVNTDAAACEFCDYAIVPRKPLTVRLIEIASLAAVLGVIILGCQALGDLIGI